MALEVLSTALRRPTGSDEGGGHLKTVSTAAARLLAQLNRRSGTQNNTLMSRLFCELHAESGSDQVAAAHTCSRLVSLPEYEACQALPGLQSRYFFNRLLVEMLQWLAALNKAGSGNMSQSANICAELLARACKRGHGAALVEGALSLYGHAEGLGLLASLRHLLSQLHDLDAQEKWLRAALKGIHRYLKGQEREAPGIGHSQNMSQLTDAKPLVQLLVRSKIYSPGKTTDGFGTAVGRLLVDWMLRASLSWESTIWMLHLLLFPHRTAFSDKSDMQPEDTMLIRWQNTHTTSSERKEIETLLSFVSEVCLVCLLATWVRLAYSTC